MVNLMIKEKSNHFIPVTNFSILPASFYVNMNSEQDTSLVVDDFSSQCAVLYKYINTANTQRSDRNYSDSSTTSEEVLTKTRYFLEMMSLSSSDD